MSSNTYRASAGPREAILLVAGTGSRLRPLTNNCPKCLLEVGGISLLKRLMLQLQKVGIERVILATGYLHDVLREEVESWNLSMHIDCLPNETYDSENNAVSLAVAMEGITEDRFLLCDGDILLHRAEPLRLLLDTPHENVLSMMRFESMGEEEMKIVCDPDGGKIRKLGKELKPGECDGESLGIQKIGPSAFALLAKRLSTMDAVEREKLYYEDIFTELIDDGVDFYACDLPPKGWTEIDTASDLDEARKMAARWEKDVILA